jgi:Sel1 repeat
MNGFNIFISDVQAIFMKRAFSAIFCCAMLLALSGAANADPASDRDMANRYLQAARSGDDDAQFYVAALYSAGVGVPRSDEEAFRWFARAADQGHSHAMLIVGGLYAIGRGVEKDNVKAYQYAYIVNSATKVEEFRNGSRQLLGVLESKMTPDEVSRARAEAGRWRPVSNAPPQPPAKTSASSNAASSANSDDLAAASDSPGKTTKKNDIDSLLDQVPQGIRKRFGF